jgi:hypothetical protein
VGRILAGADPAELTFEQSNKFAVGYTRGLSPGHPRIGASSAPWDVDGRAFAAASRTAGGAAQHVARRVSTPSDDPQRKRRW